MAQDPKPNKRRNTEYPVLLTAARTPLYPREQCAVFGCRRADAEPVSFRDLPKEPERRSEWLRLINREDLSHRRLAGGPPRVCSAHFAPHSPHTPTLLLPRKTRVQYASPGPSEMAVEIDIEPVVKTEEVDEEESTIEIQFEPETPPTYTFHETSKPETSKPETSKPEMSKPPEQPEPVISEHTQPQRLPQPPPVVRKEKTRKKKQPTLEIDCGVLRNALVQSEPNPYLEFQNNVAGQTDRIEALYRAATFSVVEKIDIPPMVAHRFDDILSRSVHAQTPPEFTDFFTDGLKRQYREDLAEAKRELQEIENTPMEKNAFVKNCDKYLNGKIGNFVKSHAYLTNKFPDSKYPLEFKYFALNLYLQNPQSYKFVEKFFELPCKGRIERFHLPLTSGVNLRLLESLKVKLGQMSGAGRMCVVTFDVMQLTKSLYYDITNDYLCGVQEIDEAVTTELAEYAALIMVRGLYNRWKQPISFALITDKRQHPELKAWILKTIQHLFGIGLQVKAFVSNIDDEFLDVSENFDVDGRTIFQIYDVPYLFKCARDALMQYDFHFDNSVAKWEDIINVYNCDKRLQHRLMPNITEEHVSPSPSAREDVKLATQVFSNSVAAAMHFHVVAKLLPRRTKDTVEFLTRMSKLYNVLSSRTLANAYRATATQNRFLKETIEWLQSIEVRDIYGNIIECKFISGLIASINSVMQLKAHLKKSNIHHLLTKNLSQNCIRTFFKEVERLQKSERPTPIQFIRGFRRLYLVDLLKNTKKGVNQDDIMKTLVKISEFVKEDLEKKDEEHRNSLAVGVTDYKLPWPSNEYLSGYLLCKCLERHACKTLIHNLCEYYRFEETDVDLLLNTFQCYNGVNINLTKPPRALIEFVNKMDNKYNEFMANFKQNASFGRCILSAIENDSFEMPCPCFPIRFLKMLFVRLKIYSTVKFCNKRLKETG